MADQALVLLVFTLEVALCPQTGSFEIFCCGRGLGVYISCLCPWMIERGLGTLWFSLVVLI